jgi:hypothetical protein
MDENVAKSKKKKAPKTDDDLPPPLKGDIPPEKVAKTKKKTPPIPDDLPPPPPLLEGDIPPLLPDDDIPPPPPVDGVRRRRAAPAPHSAEIALRDHIKLRDECLSEFNGPIKAQVTELVVEGYLLVGEIAHLDKLTIPRAANKALMLAAKKKIMKLLPRKKALVLMMKETLKPVRCPEDDMKEKLKVIGDKEKTEELVPRFEACVHINGSFLLTLEKAAEDFAEYGAIADKSVKEFYKDV